MTRLVRRLALVLAVALVPVACVLWPEGAGPGAATVPLAEALSLQARGEAVLIDVRSPDVYAAGHIPGARNVAFGEIEARTAEIRRMQRLPILYCG